MPRRTRRTAGVNLGTLVPGVSSLGRPGMHLLTLALLVLSLWSLAGFVGQVITAAQMERRKEELRAENAQLEADNTSLKARIAEAESPAYAERIAREQLGYAREGDIVILPTFPQPTPAPASPTPQALPTAMPESNWRGWVRAFFPPADGP